MWDSPIIILAEDVFRCITLVIHQNRGIYWAFGLFWWSTSANPLQSTGLLGNSLPSFDDSIVWVVLVCLIVYYYYYHYYHYYYYCCYYCCCCYYYYYYYNIYIYMFIWLQTSCGKWWRLQWDVMMHLMLRSKGTILKTKHFRLYKLFIYIYWWIIHVYQIYIWLIFKITTSYVPIRY